MTIIVDKPKREVWKTLGLAALVILAAIGAMTVVMFVLWELGVYA